MADQKRPGCDLTPVLNYILFSADPSPTHSRSHSLSHTQNPNLNLTYNLTFSSNPKSARVQGNIQSRIGIIDNSFFISYNP